VKNEFDIEVGGGGLLGLLFGIVAATFIVACATCMLMDCWPTPEKRCRDLCNDRVASYSSAGCICRSAADR